jgi:hypothetical protein
MKALFNHRALLKVCCAASPRAEVINQVHFSIIHHVRIHNPPAFLNGQIFLFLP